MGKKNKIGQAARREIRKYVRSQYQILNSVVRKRPWFVPLKLWGLMASIFIDTKRLRDYIENGVEPVSERKD